MVVKTIVIVLSLIFLISCGEGIVTVDESNYEQKIVVEGYLYPEKKVTRIRISRNLPISVNIFRPDLIIDDATVTLTDLSGDVPVTHPLFYHPDSLSYMYIGNDLHIEYGGIYRLDIQAKIDGKDLSTSSVTKVPYHGFNIIDSLSTDSIFFYQKDNQGNVLKPRIVYQRSVETDFYAFSIVALDASASTFIYDHPWVRGIEEKDVIENLHDLRFSRDTIFNTPEAAGYTIWNIEYFHTLFYGWYRITCYAGDTNFKDYFLTHANVMEFDGNLHEPKFHFEGDGIGVFGSAITETRYIKILP